MSQPKGYEQPSCPIAMPSKFLVMSDVNCSWKHHQLTGWCIVTLFHHSYSRELPSRFKKEILRPYVRESGVVLIDDINAMLTNIGHGEDCLSEQEQLEFLAAAGSKTRSIEVSKMMELME